MTRRSRWWALIVLFVGSLLAGPAVADDPPALPWATFSDAARDAEFATMGACPGAGTPAEIVIVTLRRGPAAWRYFFSPDTWRIVWLYYPDVTVVERNPDAEVDPTWVGWGEVNRARHDDIPALRWERFGPHVTGASVCRFLVLTHVS